jgi:hypothetical protein
MAAATARISLQIALTVTTVAAAICLIWSRELALVFTDDT